MMESKWLNVHFWGEFLRTTEWAQNPKITLKEALSTEQEDNLVVIFRSLNEICALT